MIGSTLLLAVEGDSLSSQEESFFKEIHPAGVTLFARNITSNKDDLIKLNDDLQELSSLPMIIAVDQEGGRVSRLKEHAPDLGVSLNLENARSDQESLVKIEDYGYEVGSALKGIGINVNFAPVLDIYTNPLNTSIGDRCFADNPKDVIRRAGAYLKGLEKTGVKGCLKHFPGQGDGNVDTHHGAAVVNHSLDLLCTREMEPFKALSQKASMVMMSHAIYPEIDDSPASLSKVMIDKYLKANLNYQGLVLSDDLLMKAISQDESQWVDNLIQAILAGTDLLLVCKGLDKAKLAYSGLKKEYENNSEFKAALDRAALRVDAFRKNLVP